MMEERGKMASIRASFPHLSVSPSVVSVALSTLNAPSAKAKSRKRAFFKGESLEQSRPIP